MEELESRPSNMACHNLLKYNPLPQGTNQLLGCNLNHCIQSSTVTDTTKDTLDWLNKVIQRRWAFLEKSPEERKHIKKLYIASEYKFSKASPEIEEVLLNFQNAVQSEQLQTHQRRKPRRNITMRKWNLIQFLCRNDKYIIVHGENNLGPCIIEHVYYIYKGCLEPLSDTRNYK